MATFAAEIGAAIQPTVQVCRVALKRMRAALDVHTERARMLLRSLQDEGAKEESRPFASTMEDDSYFALALLRVTSGGLFRTVAFAREKGAMRGLMVVEPVDMDYGHTS